MPYDQSGRTPSITVVHSKTTTVLEMEHPVVDFITLCETPYTSGKLKKKLKYKSRNIHLLFRATRTVCNNRATTKRFSRNGSTNTGVSLFGESVPDGYPRIPGYMLQLFI